MYLAVRTTSDLRKIAKSLRGADKDLRKEVRRALARGAKPLIPEARKAARQALPHTGGLNKTTIPFRTQVLMSRNPAVRIRAPRSREDGRLRHPVFGNREVWRDQPIPTEWFEESLSRNAPKVRPELLQAIDRVLDRLARKAG